MRRRGFTLIELRERGGARLKFGWPARHLVRAGALDERQSWLDSQWVGPNQYLHV